MGGQGVGLLSQFFNFPAQGSHRDRQASRPQDKTQEVRTVPTCRGSPWPKRPEQALDQSQVTPALAQTHAAPSGLGAIQAPAAMWPHPSRVSLGHRLPHLRVHTQGSVPLNEGFDDTAVGGRGRGHEHLVPLHGVQEGPDRLYH